MSNDAMPSLLSLRTGSRRASAKKAMASSGSQLALGWSENALGWSENEEPVETREPAYTPIAVDPELRPEPKLPRLSTLYTVRRLINEIRLHVEGAYTGILNVEGEISNCRAAGSGHVYFTLKDGDAQLPVVLFRRQAQLLGFKPKDGLAVEVRGRISVYESRGQLQLIAETLRPRGTGALQLAFEQVRDRLRMEGLFDRAKRPLPAFPQCIGIITSPHGAAIRDIVQVIRRRHARLNLLIYPALMQGAHCPALVAAGLRWFNRNPGRVDLVLLARGGGSLEDLAGFNDEALARAIAASALPVVSAIGHEVDNTIADYVADLRAPTPSAAAELITAAQHRIEERVAMLQRRVGRAAQFHLLQARQRMQRLSAEHVLSRLRDSISLREQHVDELRRRIEAACARLLRQRALRLAQVATKLQRHDPTFRLTLAQRRFAVASERMLRLSGELTARKNARLERALARLQALSPLAVLNRGYAIVYLDDMQTGVSNVLRDAREAQPNQQIRARLARGSVRAIVSAIEEDAQEPTR